MSLRSSHRSYILQCGNRRTPSWSAHASKETPLVVGYVFFNIAEHFSGQIANLSFRLEPEVVADALETLLEVTCEARRRESFGRRRDATAGRLPSPLSSVTLARKVCMRCLSSVNLRSSATSLMCRTLGSQRFGGALDSTASAIGAERLTGFAAFDLSGTVRTPLQTYT